jgi:hypothetical protein
MELKSLKLAQSLKALKRVVYELLSEHLLFYLSTFSFLARKSLVAMKGFSIAALAGHLQ